MFSSLLGAVALASASPAPFNISFDDQISDIQYPLVHQVKCDEGRGSAFRIGPTEFASVAHVTSLHNCKIDGYPIHVLEQDGRNDFSVVESGPPKLGALKIDCAGFTTFEWYWAAGYAWGRSYQTDVAINASGYFHTNGQRMFTGRHTVIPGMSGGPVMNTKGEVVGTVNMYNPDYGVSFSRSLQDTILCRA